MDIKNILSVSGGVLFVAAFIPYVISILKDKTKPAKASWFIWAVLDTTAFLAMWATHTLNWVIIVSPVCAWSVVFLALYYGIPGWSKTDKFCLVGAALGILLWYMFDNPLFGIVISQIVTFIGSIPTFVSAWEDPKREDKLAWITLWLSCFLTLISISSLKPAESAQPITFFVIETVVVYILLLRG